MTEPLGVTPAELRAASEYLADVSGQMKDVKSSLLEMLGREGEAWGDDKIGTQFASGGRGYRMQSDWGRWLDRHQNRIAGLLFAPPSNHC